MNENETRKNKTPLPDASAAAPPVSGRDSVVSPPDAGVRFPTEVTMVNAPNSAPNDGKYATELTMVDAQENRHVTDVTMLQNNPPSSSEETAADDLQPGDRIDRYTIVKKIGQGGMGSVYLVRHETLGIFRAAKILSGALYKRGGEFVKRFIQEARMACSISNPNIVNVLDVGDDSARGLCYIIMEYVDGGTIRDVLHTIPRLSEIHAVIIAEAVAEALKAAAEQKIVHRDIKPDNIMLTRRGEVKLADLGIAKNTDENVQLTKSHVMMGTPAYLAPEQAQDAHSVDVRADIYSLGATLYEMLTGEIPYPGKSTYDILTKLVSDPVPDPRTLVDTISPQTARLVMKMLAKQAKLRHRNAAELLREIRGLNLLPADFDAQKSIRELLEQSGAGNYSAVSLTPTTGNPVSTWLMRHVFLKLETSLRKVPVFAKVIDAMHRDIRIFYLTISVVTLLLIGIPVTLVMTAPPEIPDEPFSQQTVQDTTPISYSPSDSTVVPRQPDEKLVRQQAEPVPVKPPIPVKPESVTIVPPPTKPNPETARDTARLTEEKRKLAEEQRQLEQERRALEAERRRAAQRKAEDERNRTASHQTPNPKAPEVKKITVFVEITPIGAEAVLRNDQGKAVAALPVPVSGKVQFHVPAGQYKLQVSAIGFKTVERAFPVSDSRTLTCVKVDLQRDVCACVMKLYGNAKLLGYIKKDGVEIRIDDGEWRKAEKFPYEIDLTRQTHTVALRGKGVTTITQTLKIAPEQAQCAVELYLTEKDARLEISTQIEDNISVNLFGIWEPLKKSVPLSPFRAYSLKWRIAGGREETIAIPELLPDTVHKIILEREKRIVHPGEAEFSEAEKLLKDGENKDAVEKLKEADAKGHPEAAYMLGVLAEQGKGRWFASDGDALAFYKKAAEPPYNHAIAQLKMGIFHEKGRGGLERDIKRAIEWYKKSAAQNNPDAIFRVGMAYKDGDGNEPVDYTMMVEFFTKASKAGQPDAQYQLGYCYENGIGVPINTGMAKYWYEKAAEQGNQNARRRGKALEGLK